MPQHFTNPQNRAVKTAQSCFVAPSREKLGLATISHPMHIWGAKRKGTRVQNPEESEHRAYIVPTLRNIPRMEIQKSHKHVLVQKSSKKNSWGENGWNQRRLTRGKLTYAKHFPTILKISPQVKTQQTIN